MSQIKIIVLSRQQPHNNHEPCWLEESCKCETYKYQSFTTLNMVGCTSLLELNCSDNQLLTDLWLSDCNALRKLNISGCALRNVELSECRQLQELKCGHCPLDTLDVSTCTCLVEVLCDGTNIRSLDVSAAAATLTKLCCGRCILIEVICATDCKKLKTWVAGWIHCCGSWIARVALAW